jgi:hypothetical protein
MSEASEPETAREAPQALALPERRRRPSAGFVAVCVTYVAVAAFLAFGLQTPVLERIWTLHHELKVGLIGAPAKADVKLLRRALLEHAGLARALLPEGEIGLLSAHRDGWLDTPEATVLRTARARAGQLRVEVGTPLDLLPFTIDVDGHAFHTRVVAREHGVLDVTLPPPSGKPELFVVKLVGKALRADPSVLNVRLTFAEGRS